MLEQQDYARYNRHLRLKGFGEAGQVALKRSRVLIIGAGGLGCPIGLYLAAAGVGVIGVVDDDHIELSNLQRQIAHHDTDTGQPKVDSLIRAMRELNPSLEYVAHPRRLTVDWVRELIRDYDLIIDGTDNYTTRYLVNDACVLEKKTLVFGAIHQFDAQLSVFKPGHGPCLRCLFPEPPDPSATPSCSEAGVLGVLPGAVGVMMATEAVKVLTGIGEPLIGVLAIYNALDTTIRHIRLARDPACALCGEAPTIHEVVAHEFVCATPETPTCDVGQAKAMIESGAHVLDVREPHEWAVCHLDQARHAPLGELSTEDLAGWTKDAPIVVYCYRGGRSLKAAATLHDWGFQGAVSMDGGIDAWAQQIEPEMARY